MFYYTDEPFLKWQLTKEESFGRDSVEDELLGCAADR